MQPIIRWSLVAISVAAPALSTPLSTSPYTAERAVVKLAPLHHHEPHAVIDDSYIVLLKDGISPSLMENHLNFLQQAHQADPLQAESSGIRHIYDGHIQGYAGKFSSGVVQQLRAMPEVALVEHDSIVHTMNHTVQKGAPWGLARISHRKRLGFSTFTKFEYEEQGGQGVDVYVVDTGINVKHIEFEKRAVWGTTVPENDVDEDGNGHGTHCAGTIASRKFGVAKKANVIAVKVLGSNGSGSMSDVVAGVLWAAKKAKAKKDESDEEYRTTGKTSHKGSVANMSLGGGKSPALDRAVNGAVDSGLHFAVAAGNDNRDACNYSPAAAEKAVTVGASTLGDDRAYFSNHGPCVDVFAPGLNILSTWTGSPTATNTISGTSMASPHVAGLIAYFLSLYPHETFAPLLDEALVQPITLQQVLATPTSFYALVHSSLPRFISEHLPSPKLVSAVTGDNVAPIPIPKPRITPAQLKAAVLTLSTEGILKDLPDKTINLLVFNNATSS